MCRVVKGFLREVFAELSLKRGGEVGQVKRAPSRGNVTNEHVGTSVGFASVKFIRAGVEGGKEGYEHNLKFWTSF